MREGKIGKGTRFVPFTPTTKPGPRLVVRITLHIHSVIRFARLSHNTVVNKYRIFSKPFGSLFFSCSQKLYLL